MLSCVDACVSCAHEAIGGGPPRGGTPLSDLLMFFTTKHSVFGCGFRGGRKEHGPSWTSSYFSHVRKGNMMDFLL